MSHAEVWDDGAAPATIPTVRVASLGVGSPYRAGGLCEEQVDRLAALGGSWPPVLVSAADDSLIDGAHRVAAARRLGLARIEVEHFHGRADEAFVEFVRRNTTHGLALTLAERKAAASRVLREHGRWSDRRIAEVCALSPKTVARLRRDGCPSAEASQSDGAVREGRDHRLRPARAGSARARVLEALRDDPSGSLRTIAAAAGVSPETVRLVRLNLAQAPAPATTEEVVGEAPADGELAAGWRRDAALASADAGDDLVSWLERTAVGAADRAWADAVPLGRVYVVADEARRRSETWLEIARAVEARAARSR